MKRSGADMRKRNEQKTVENERLRGPLTDEEIEAVRQAYDDGCSGELIIGMRGEERILMMLVPETTDIPVQDRLLHIREELRRLGCDGMTRTRRFASI